MSPHPRNCSKAIWATETRLNPFGVLPEESLTSSKSYVIVSDQYLPWEKVHFSYLIWSTGLFLLYQHLASHTSEGKMWQNDNMVKCSKLVAAGEQPYRKDAGRLPPKFSA